MPDCKRHPDLFDSEEAAAYMGVGRITDLPEEFKPAPVAYHRSLFHRRALDEAIDRAANVGSAKKGLKVAS